MATAKVLILRSPGTNCDNETAFAFQLAGAVTGLYHINRLIDKTVILADYQILAIPGGFSYGDDIAGGKIQANEIKARLDEDIKRFIENGGLILGICNGFQVLAKTGYLSAPSMAGRQAFTLANNDSGRFECRWIHMLANPKSNCVFIQGIEKMYLPVAHGEGKVIADPEVISGLNIALRYCDENGEINANYPVNPNGSMDNIAGIADATGRVFALMPHPERYIRNTQHPAWTRTGTKNFSDGLPIFTNAVKWVKGL